MDKFSVFVILRKKMAKTYGRTTKMWFFQDVDGGWHGRALVGQEVVCAGSLLDPTPASWDV